MNHFVAFESRVGVVLLVTYFTFVIPSALVSPHMSSERASALKSLPAYGAHMIFEIEVDNVAVGHQGSLHLERCVTLITLPRTVLIDRTVVRLGVPMTTRPAGTKQFPYLINKTYRTWTTVTKNKHQRLNGLRV